MNLGWLYKKEYYIVTGRTRSLYQSVQLVEKQIAEREETS